MDEGAAIEYGADPNAAALFDGLMTAIAEFGKQRLASHIGISCNTLTKIIAIKCQKLSPRLSEEIALAISALNSHLLDEERSNSNLLELARAEIAKIGLSEFAQRLKINKSNLKNILDGRRKAGQRFVYETLSRLSRAVLVFRFSKS